MQLEMINVGFGDCFLLGQNEKNLLVDCGTISFQESYKYKRFSQLVDDLHNRLSQTVGNNSALITHFHEDHYKGIKMMSAKNKVLFSTIYVPRFTIDTTSKRMVDLELAIYIYYLFPEMSHSRMIAKNVLEQIVTLSKLVNNFNISCLYTNKAFNVGNRRFRVLWPDKEIDYDRYIINLLKYLDRAMSNDEDFILIKDLIIKNFSKWYNLCDEENDAQNNSEIMKNLIEENKELLDKLDYLREHLFSKIDIYFYWSHYDMLCWMGKIFGNDLNRTSIVFDDFDKNIYKKILMTGDITKEIINVYLKKRFYKEYFIVKSPHHGTYGHYTKNLPKAKQLLISNGGARSKKVGWGIADEYRTKYKRFAKRICTSGNKCCRGNRDGKRCIHNTCRTELYSTSL